MNKNEASKAIKQSVAFVIPTVACPAFAVPSADPILDKVESVRSRLVSFSQSDEAGTVNVIISSEKGSDWVAWGNWRDWPNYWNDWRDWNNWPNW